MKKNILICFVIFTAAVFSNVTAQQEMPSGASDKNLGDNNIKMRSVDLERAKRDAEKTNSTGANVASVNPKIETKFPQIKEDFEGIQSNQELIVKSYTSGAKVDYKQIKDSADLINKSAKRLDENLFAVKTEKPKENSKKENKEKSISDLIVDLDNAIGKFAASTMFQNLRLVNPEIAGKTQLDLMKIMQISDLLSKQADKMK